MSLRIGIGTNLRIQGSSDWASYWAHSGLFLFFASDPTNILNKVAATQLPNQVTGSSDFFTVTGTGLNARYRTPDNATYRAADSDYVFWKTDASESTCDGNRLIGYDFPRILVKYLNVAPYTILWIGILKPGSVVTNAMRDSFDLNVWWDNTLSDHGNLKQNRGIGQSVWTAESVLPNDSWLGRWDFNGDTNDTSGQGNHLLNQGATLTTDNLGNANKAYDFSGAAQDMVKLVPIAVPNDVFAITMRFKQDALVNFASLFGDTDNSSYAQGYLIYQTATGLRFFVGEWTTVSASKNHIDIALSDTTSWHFLCAMYSKATGKMYFSIDNGALQEANVSYTIVSLNVLVGIGYGPSYFNGKMDQIYFYNRLLTTAEITALYNYYL